MSTPLGAIPVTQVGKDMPWWEDAACAQTDPELFFIDPGDSAAPARAVCGRCRVRTQCLQDAVKHDDRYGIRGGTTPDQRAVLQKRCA